MRLECFDPSILKDGEPARHPRSINLAAVHGQKPGRLLPRERVRSLAPKRRSIEPGDWRLTGVKLTLAIRRREWPGPRIVSPAEMRPEMNVNGLRWRKP